MSALSVRVEHRPLSHLRAMASSGDAPLVSQAIVTTASQPGNSTAMVVRPPKLSKELCLLVLLLCALPSHRSASDALMVLGGSSTLSLEELRAKPRIAFEITDEESLRAIMVRTPPQGNHHLPCRAVVVNPLLTFPILPFFSLFLSTASRRKPHIVKFYGDYALRARLPVGSAQPATSVAGPSFVGRSGHNQLQHSRRHTSAHCRPEAARASNQAAAAPAAPDRAAVDRAAATLAQQNVVAALVNPRACHGDGNRNAISDVR